VSGATQSLQLIVLAAGAATRFGSAKQLAMVQGQPMLRVVLGRAVDVAGNAVSVVLGAHAAEIAPLLGRMPVTIIANHNWREGLASSIRAGVERLPGSCSGAMLVLADQVNVSVADLQRLTDAWRRAPLCIVAAQYRGTIGAPVIFPRSDFRALLELRGDRGAQLLLRRNEARVIKVQMPGAAVDIDTPEDLATAAVDAAG
jgi:molybdenum cofactor cytidylyltransferase